MIKWSGLKLRDIVERPRQCRPARLWYLLAIGTLCPPVLLAAGVSTSTGAITGAVVDDTGKPVNNARVLISHAATAGGASIAAPPRNHRTFGGYGRNGRAWLVHRRRSRARAICCLRRNHRARSTRPMPLGRISSNLHGHCRPNDLRREDRNGRRSRPQNPCR